MSETKLRIVFLSLINILMEYSLRGVFDVAHNPLILLPAFFNYFVYFTIVEDSIRRYKLNDKQIYLLSLVFGITWQLFGPSLLYLPPLIIINWIALIFVNFIWWGTLQTILAIYMVNRMVPRTSTEPFLSDKSRKIYIGLFCFIALLFRLGGAFPLPNPLQLILVGGILFGAYKVYKKSLNEQNKDTTQPSPSRFLDIISILTLLYLAWSAFILDGETVKIGLTSLNQTALRLNLVVTFLLALSIGIYRVMSKRRIPV